MTIYYKSKAVTLQGIVTKYFLLVLNQARFGMLVLIMFADNPENFEGRYPGELYGYYMTEAEGDCFEDDFYDGIQEFIEIVESIAETNGRLATGDEIETYDEVGEEDRITIQNIQSGLILREFSPGAASIQTAAGNYFSMCAIRTGWRAHT